VDKVVENLKGPGKLLIEGRTLAGFSVVDIADRLNLSEDVVEQLESDHYKGDIPDAFMRGYLRTYARLVSLDEEPLIQLYTVLTGKEKVENNYVPSKDVPPMNIQIGSHLLWFRLVSVAVVIAILSLGWFAFNKTNSQKEHLKSAIVELNTTTSEPQHDAIASTGVDGSSIPTGFIGESDDESDDISIQQSIHTDTNPIERLDASAVPISNEEPEYIEKTDLDFTFIEDCWVQVIDSRSEVLAVGLKTAGRHFTISGVPPIRIVLGKPRAVGLQYDNQAVDLSIYPAGQSAKFTLGQ